MDLLVISYFREAIRNLVGGAYRQTLDKKNWFGRMVVVE